MRWGYAAAALAVFLIEVAIALFVRDAIVRPYVGDMLAVVLVYLALRAGAPLRVGPAVVLALVIAFAIEAGQAAHLLDRLGLGGSRLLRVVLGGTFDVRDLACYGGGALGVFLIERGRRG